MSELWTDQEWWDANLDFEATEKALAKAGITVTGWINRKPRCVPEDMTRVQAALKGQLSPPFAAPKRVAAPSKKVIPKKPVTKPKKGDKK